MKKTKENLNLMSDEMLLTKTRFLAAESHRITADLLLYLAVVDKRMLYASLGYSSLFEFVTLELGFAGGSAQRRIEAMRLHQEFPEIHEKIESGALSLTNASQARKFFKQEKMNKNPLTKTEKSIIIESLTGKSTREAERDLASLSSNPAEFLARDRIKPVAENYSEVRFLADQELIVKLAQIQNLLSHTHPNMSMAELISEISDIALKKLKASRFAEVQKPRKKATQPSPVPQETEVVVQDGEASEGVLISRAGNENFVSKKRTISASIRREVFERDGTKCTYVDAVSGRPCSSTYQLELDHIKPFAQGGENSVANLRVRCRVHNRLHAIYSYGLEKMLEYSAIMEPEEVNVG